VIFDSNDLLMQAVIT